MTTNKNEKSREPMFFDDYLEKLQSQRRIDKKETELQEKIENEPKKKETHFNHALIKNRIKALKMGYNLGQLDTKQSIKKIQNEIVQYAKKNMPLDEAGKREVNELLELVMESQSIEKLEDAFYLIDDKTTGIEKQRVIGEIDKRLNSQTREGLYDLLNQLTWSGKLCETINNKNNSMKRIVVKLLIAIVIGIIIGVGSSFEFKYYIHTPNNPKREITKELYKSYEQSDLYCFNEINFNPNKRNSIGLAVAALMSIILFYPEMKDVLRTKKG
jgi:hypothetical protein